MQQPIQRSSAELRTRAVQIRRLAENLPYYEHEQREGLVNFASKLEKEADDLDAASAQ